MNFDVNTLSTLMQMMSAMKPRADESPKPQENSMENKNRENPSVFAMQNGLGDTVEIGGSKKAESKKSPSQNASMGNPMAAILEMLTGSKSQSGGGDMMSTLMPMLMNMMGGRQAQAQSSQNAQGSNNNSSGGNTGYNQNSNNNNANNQNSNSSDVKGSDVEARNEKAENNYKMKTQPTHDKYEPIAFAGYTLISALNKLYIAKCV
ncbi:MAG: hypothetical protein K2G31_05730 [Clostridia bacterium]|nr:hypothetical protein [Clostridia bacterium]